MKKFLKLAIIPAAFLTVGLTTGCGSSVAEVALITDVGDIDDGSFNQSSWEAIKEYCTDPAHTLTHDYYRPTADSDFARRLAIQQAVAKKAKIIICPGFKFASTISRAQLDYPDVHFVLLDSTTNNYKMKNTLCANYSPEISGFMAGYAVAQDYLKYDKDHGGIKTEYKYGYCGGMSYASVYTFGYGFVQGCVLGTKDFMEKEVNTDYPKLSFNFNYAGVFAQDDGAAARIKDWYADGYKAVFACGGKLYQSITEGVKDYNKKNGYDRAKEGELDRNAARWVGVDTDQYSGLADLDDKKTIITSALKGLRPTILTALDKHHTNDWSDIGDTTKVDSPKVFVTEKAATDYLNDDRDFVGTKPIFSGFDTKIVQEGESYRIQMKPTGTADSEYFTYGEQNKKSWLLSLNSKLGWKETNPEQDFVGLPTENDKDPDTKVMRGFFNFNKGQYKELKNEIVNGKYKGKIYGLGGDELYYKDPSKPESKPSKIEDKDNPRYVSAGYPTFMSYSGDYYIPPVGEESATETFNNKYFFGYAPSQIVVNVI